MNNTSTLPPVRKGSLLPPTPGEDNHWLAMETDRKLQCNLHTLGLRLFFFILHCLSLTIFLKEGSSTTVGTLSGPWTTSIIDGKELRWNSSLPDAEQRDSICRPGGVRVEGTLKFYQYGKGSGPQTSKKCHPNS